jgi:hypothetical protein
MVLEYPTACKVLSHETYHSLYKDVDMKHWVADVPVGAIIENTAEPCNIVAQHGLFAP